MNKAKYDGLPADLKKVIDDNSGARLRAISAASGTSGTRSAVPPYLKRNTPIHVIDGADLAAWKKATEPITASGSKSATRPATTAPSCQGGAGAGRQVRQVSDRTRRWRGQPEPHGPVGRALERVCEAVAMLGGLLLVAIMLVSSVSVIGTRPVATARREGLGHTWRYRDRAARLRGGGVCVPAALPAQARERAGGGFTKNLPVRYRSMFDLAANLLFLVLASRWRWQLGTARRRSSATATPRWCCGFRRAGPMPPRSRSLWLLVLVTAYRVAAQRPRDRARTARSARRPSGRALKPARCPNFAGGRGKLPASCWHFSRCACRSAWRCWRSVPAASSGSRARAAAELSQDDAVRDLRRTILFRSSRCSC